MFKLYDLKRYTTFNYYCILSMEVIQTFYWKSYPNIISTTI